MKKMFKQEKGVSLISLGITVIIITMLTTMLIYNAKDSLYIKNLKNMYNDIDNLREKVSQFYNEYGDIPASISYTNIDDKMKNNVLNKIELQHLEQFYVIDLQALEGLTLNYGKDFEKIKNDPSQVNDTTDLYIIHKSTHNIFYARGIEVKEKDNINYYYTDYVEPDNTVVNYRYVNGVKIPENYYCINTETITISTDKNEVVDEGKENQFTWIAQITQIDKKPDSVILGDDQTEESFINSVNVRKGYFKNERTNRVIFIPVEEDKWSQTYSKRATYTDLNGDKAYVPTGFTISMSPLSNTIEKGLIAQDGQGNSFVWIQVPQKVIGNSESDDDIEIALRNYSGTYRKTENQDQWYNGCGLEEEQYKALKSKMLQSIKKNGGFWISQYEIGLEGENPVSKQGINPNTNTTCAEAQELAQKVSVSNEYETNLLFGLQWDLACKFIENKGANLGNTLTERQELIKNNSTEWGNYQNSTFTLTKGQYAIYNQTTNQLGSWNRVTNSYTKPNTGNQNKVMLQTGIVKQNQLLNIYDFAGNVAEWTLEKGSNENQLATVRGGSFLQKGNDLSASSHVNIAFSAKDIAIGFRVALY